MAQNKTVATDASVRKYLEGIDDENKRTDCERIAGIMQKVTGQKPVMWGTSIVGFGSYHYVYDSGREGDMCLTGFAARKANIAVYIMDGFAPHSDLMEKLGKYRTGKSCLYIKGLSDVDTDVLEQLISDSVRVMRERHVTE